MLSHVIEANAAHQSNISTLHYFRGGIYEEKMTKPILQSQ